MITRANYEIWFLDYAEGRLNSTQQKAVLQFVNENPDLKKEFESFDAIQLEENKEKSLPSFSLKKKQSWLLDKYSKEELVFHVVENLLSPEEIREWNDLLIAKPELLKLVEQEKSLVLQPVANEKASFKSLLKKDEAVFAINRENYNEYFIQYVESKNLNLHKAILSFIGTDTKLKREFQLAQKTILVADTTIVFGEKDRLRKKEKVVVFAYWQYAAIAAVLILAILFFNPFDRTEKFTPVAKKNQDKKEFNPISEPKNPQESIALQNDYIVKDEVKSESQNENGVQQKNLPSIKKQRPSFSLASVDKRKINAIGQERNLKDSLKARPLPPQQHFEEVADNTTPSVKSDNGYDNPLDFAAAVINKKYYEDVTPVNEQANSFYAMKNVVKTTTNAEINKKEDDDYKEFSVKIGKFGLTRKKAK